MVFKHESLFMAMVMATAMVTAMVTVMATAMATAMDHMAMDLGIILKKKKKNHF